MRIAIAALGALFTAISCTSATPGTTVATPSPAVATRDALAQLRERGSMVVVIRVTAPASLERAGAVASHLAELHASR